MKIIRRLDCILTINIQYDIFYQHNDFPNTRIQEISVKFEDWAGTDVSKIY